MQILGKKSGLEVGLMVVVPFVIMGTFWNPLKYSLGGDLVALALSELILGAFIGFIVYVIKSQFENYYNSALEALVMGNLEANKFALGIAILLSLLLISVEAWASSQTASNFGDKLIENQVKNSGKYQIMQNQAQGKRDETIAYNNALKEYNIAKSQHIESCNQTYNDNYKTKRANCINDFDMKPPTLEKISMNSDVSINDYNALESEQKDKTALTSWLISFVMMSLVTALSVLSWFLTFRRYKEIENKIRISRAFALSLREMINKNIEGDSFYIEQLSGANCEFRKAQGTNDSANKLKEAQLLKDEAKKTLSSIGKHMVKIDEMVQLTKPKKETQISLKSENFSQISENTSTNEKVKSETKTDDNQELEDTPIFKGELEEDQKSLANKLVEEYNKTLNEDLTNDEKYIKRKKLLSVSYLIGSESPLIGNDKVKREKAKQTLQVMRDKGLIIHPAPTHSIITDGKKTTIRGGWGWL